MRKATLQQYLQIGNMIESGAIDRSLAQAIIESSVVIRSSIGEPEGVHPYRNAPSNNSDVRQEAIEFFTPLSDANVPEQYQTTLAKYRKLATKHDVLTTTPVCYRVSAGFTLKTYAPKLGPCYEDFQYLQNWNFPDEATSDCLVFWVPRIVKGSTSKTASKQKKLLTRLRTKLELSAHHMNNFGKVGLVAGLILAHFKATGERIPLDQYWVRTDTCDADGIRLLLGRFGDAGLDCLWLFGGRADVGVGVFAFGVEVLGL